MRFDHVVFVMALGVATLSGTDAAGDAPAPVALASIRGTVDPSLTRQLTDAVVYVKQAGGAFVPPREPAQIEQRGRTFMPRVLPVMQGTRVRFPNRDVVRHNVFSPSKGNAFNFGIYLPGDTREVTFQHPGVVTLLCNIHEEMSAYVLVLQNPHFARVDATGRYAIEGVQDGSYTLELWADGRVARTQTVVVRGATTANMK